MSEIHSIVVSEEASGQRLDKYLSQTLPEMSRSRLQGLIAQGALTHKGEAITDANAKVKAGSVYILAIPEAIASHIAPEDIALDVIFEDEHLLVINKPARLTVHPAPGHADGTLVNALLAHCGASLSGIGGVARPGIVHRIDKDTSGLLVVAKHDAAHNHLSAQLSDHSLKRTYRAIVWGEPKALSGTITGNIGRSTANRQRMAVVKSGGKEAVTHYKVLEKFQPAGIKIPMAALVECNLETGRTHQIRVHFTHIGHPLLGDPAYGPSTATQMKQNIYKPLSDAARETIMGFQRQALHALKLGLIHPATGEEMHFSCPMPADMEKLITALH
ncbi:MAG: RluA family pseudouridine synthase [Rickettsiales bacterium]|nr:RluA family pseudouridine synthase [Rickettsiales bacterium]